MKCFICWRDFLGMVGIFGSLVCGLKRVVIPPDCAWVGTLLHFQRRLGEASFGIAGCCGVWFCSGASSLSFVFLFSLGGCNS
jgi:hypothetical protein